MGTDSFMEMLRSDLNGLSAGNALVTEQIYADLTGWYTWACDTLAKHATDLEVKVMSSIIAQAMINGDIKQWKALCHDQVYTTQGFTPLGERLYNAYVQVVRQTVDVKTQQYLALQQRPRKPLLVQQRKG